MTESVAKQAQKAPLEDLMAAMDVVDTLRHQQGIAERELNAEARRERLLQRLQEMYRAQGIDVPEQVLLEGIAALEEERFSYTPVEPSWRTKLAHLWVSRTRWGKPVGFLSLIAGLLWGVYFAIEVMPGLGLEQKVADAVELVEQQAKSPEAIAQARQLAASADVALRKGDVATAQADLTALQELSELLGLEYTLRVVSRPGIRSGVWRVPPGDSNVRNHYLIVEAIDRNNRALQITVLNEEDNKTARLKAWGLRVSQGFYRKVVADKQDDGIIQANKVGVKRAGYLRPEFSIPTTGATITEW